MCREEGIGPPVFYLLKISPSLLRRKHIKNTHSFFEILPKIENKFNVTAKARRFI